MQYNIHPIFVHFPIALLFLYSTIKILPLRRWLPQIAWKQIKITLLFFGILGAFAALSTGEAAEHLVRPNHDLVEAHSMFASIATWIYATLLLGEILLILMPKLVIKVKSTQIIKFLNFLKNFITHRVTSTMLAITGLISISITGILGGVIVYGTSADPLAGILLKLLGINL